MTLAALLAVRGQRVIAIAPDAGVAEAAALLAGRRIGTLAVQEGTGPLLGLIGEEEITRGLARQGAAVLSLPVRALMCEAPRTATPHTALPAALEMMGNGHLRHLPVLDEGGRALAILSLGELLRHVIRLGQGEASALVSFIAGQGYAVTKLPGS
ncbi:MAG: CBS domain-containing protein [Rhodovarius sp.]|nr:CBS domain-containing protein [Rhodovarius sp.]